MKLQNYLNKALLILLIVCYILSFRNVILNLNNEGALLQGDDIGGFLRHIALVAKWWIFKPIPAHQDQLFTTSLSNIIGAFIYRISSNILLSYLVAIALLMFFGSYGLKELLSLYGVKHKHSKLIAITFFIFNPAIASMIFTGEEHIVTTYFMLPYVLLLMLVPSIKKDLNITKYLLYALILLLHIPYIHAAFMLQSLLVILPYTLINLIINKENRKLLKENMGKVHIFSAIIFVTLVLVISVFLKVKHIAIHEPVKLHVLYPINIYKKHAMQNIFEAFTLRPSTLSYNHYSEDTPLYMIGSLTTAVTLVLTTSITIIAFRYLPRRKVVMSLLLFIVLSIVFGLGPNNPYPVSMIFEYLFVHYKVFNLLRMAYRYHLLIVFAASILICIIVDDIINMYPKIKLRRPMIRFAKIFVISMLILVALNAIFVSVQGFNGVVSVPDDWISVLEFIKNAKYNNIQKFIYVPSYPYTTILTPTPSKVDVGSINYLATFLEVKTPAVVYSNDYLYSDLLRLLFTLKEHYPSVALNLFKNLRANGIVVSKQIYPATKVDVVRKESSYFYNYIEKLTHFNSVYHFDISKNTSLILFKEKHDIMASNSLVIAYPFSYWDLALVLKYFNKAPIVIGYDNSAGIKTLISKVNNVKIYIVLSNNTLIPFIFSVGAKSTYEPQSKELISWVFSPFIKFYRIYNDTRLNLKFNSSTPILLLIPIFSLYDDSSIEIITKGYAYNYSVSKGLQYYMIPLPANTTYVQIIIKTSKWIGLGAIHILEYDDLEHLYHLLSEKMSRGDISIILIKSDYLRPRVIIPFTDVKGVTVVVVKIFKQIMNLILYNTKTLFYSLYLRGDVDLGKYVSKGYVYVQFPNTSVITVNMKVNIYGKGISLSLGGIYSIIISKSPKIENTIIVTARIREKNSWIPIYILDLKNTSTVEISLKIDSATFRLKTSTLNRFNKVKTYEFKTANPIGLPKFIWLGIYKDSNITLRGFEIILDNSATFNLNKVKYLHGTMRIDIPTIFIKNITIREVEATCHESRELFKYSCRLHLQKPVNFTPVFSLYEYPYTAAWHSSSCLMLSGIFNSYIVLIPIHNSTTCTVFYTGFIYTDLYYILLVVSILSIFVAPIFRRIHFKV